MSRPPHDVKKEVSEYLCELHQPAIRRCFEEAARQAERETLGYEQYLLELVERECQQRHANHIARLLQASRLPLEKTAYPNRGPAHTTRSCGCRSDGSSPGPKAHCRL